MSSVSFREVKTLGSESGSIQSINGKELDFDEEVNAYLAKGWELIGTSNRRMDSGSDERLCTIGWPQNGKPELPDFDA